jgi:putative toxin-antitoxin system antitoxin component (TIGR02293 family)
LTFLSQLPAGLPASLARELAQKMEVTLEDMSGLLRLNPRTFQRRMDEGILSLNESERLWELSRLFFRALDVLESVPGAIHWFKNRFGPWVGLLRSRMRAPRLACENWKIFWVGSSTVFIHERGGLWRRGWRAN